MVEIGSFSGESAQIFLDSGKFSWIACIDPWAKRTDYGKGLEFYKFYGTIEQAETKFDTRFQNNTIIKKVKHYSKDVNCLFKDHSLDLVYIDGNHKYEECLQDIMLYLPKIKPGRFIAGHDYDKKFPGVIQAVNEVFKGKEIKVFRDTSWRVQI